jgi:hypothetical protein
MGKSAGMPSRSQKKQGPYRVCGAELGTLGMQSATPDAMRRTHGTVRRPVDEPRRRRRLSMAIRSLYEVLSGGAVRAGAAWARSGTTCALDGVSTRR